MLYFGKGNERGKKRGNKADWSNSGLGECPSVSFGVFLMSQSILTFFFFLLTPGPAKILCNFEL